MMLWAKLFGSNEIPTIEPYSVSLTPSEVLIEEPVFPVPNQTAIGSLNISQGT